MAAKTTKVTLLRTDTQRKVDFEITHAERLLSMRNNGGWELPTDSNFELKNGTIVRRNKGKDKAAKEEGND